jgi:hypothetical protein
MCGRRALVGGRAPRVKAWLAAFLFTQLVEVPIYARALSPRRWPVRLGVAFGASALTHPLVWIFVTTFAREHYAASVVIAESFAIVVEALWIKAFGVKRSLEWSLLANATSLGLGLACRAIFGWP